MTQIILFSPGYLNRAGGAFAKTHVLDNGMSEVETKDSCPLVGVGASAGGLEALFTLLESVKMPLGMALVILQHSSPDHESLLPTLLARHSDLPVHQLEDGEHPQPDHVYVAPPGRLVEFREGVLHLADGSESRTPIDHFFRSLAAALTTRCAGVLLSGAGSDGTVGLKAIRDKGGLTVAQDPSTASYCGMPSSAISQRAADLVLKPEEIMPQLVSHFRNPSSPRDMEQLAPLLPRFLQLVRGQTGQDFSNYKETTIKRRILHRMGVRRISSSEEYLLYLEHHPGEVERLAGDLLVGVTSFFRDTEAFRSLEQQAFPALVSNREPHDAIRIWVPGCSTGEEAYSIAISLSEFLERENRTDQQFNIFATDLDSTAVETARTACYPQGAALDIPQPLLEKYLTRSGAQYEVAQELRQKLTFAVHSVFKDPPFSRMDLISCRNLLIYLQPGLQEQVLSLLHYSLKTGGFLLLGNSEGTGRFLDHFECVDRQWKLFRKLPRSGRSDVFRELPLSDRLPALRARTPRPALRGIVEKTLLEQFCPTAVVTDSRGEILYIHGDSERFLTPPKGEADFSLLRMAREELKAPLMSLLAAVMKDAEPRSTVATLESDSAELKILPFGEAERTHPSLILILFRLRPAGEPSGQPSTTEDCSRVRALEKELDATRAYLRSTIDKLETTNEELETLNEELQSANEELLSTNEELETSREELLSVNEELALVNKELNEQVVIGKAAVQESANFLNSIDLAVIHVDNAATIRRFTPAASRLVSLLPSDLGRPLNDLAFHLEVGGENLAREVQDVIQSLTTIDREVLGSDGDWYALRIRPHRTVSNVMDGAILTFVNVSAQKLAAERLRLASDAATHSPQPLMMLDPEGEIVYRNPQTVWKLGEQPDFWKSYQTQTGGDGPWRSVTRCLDGNGGLARREIVIRPVADQSGRTVSLIATETFHEESESLFVGGHLLYLDGEGSIIRVNRELAEVLDRTQESFQGKDWLEEFVLQTDRDKARPFFLSCRRTGECSEARVLTPQGPLLFRWRALALAEVSPGEDRRIFSGENISESHRARRTITRSRGLMKVFRILNESMRRQVAQERLLQDVCEALVSEAEYVRAWIGFVDVDHETVMTPVVASGHAERVSCPAVLLSGVLADGPRPFVHHQPEAGIVTIVLPLQLEDCLGLLELDSDWDDFLEDEVQALRQFSAALGELLSSVRCGGK